MKRIEGPVFNNREESPPWHYKKEEDTSLMVRMLTNGMKYKLLAFFTAIAVSPAGAYSGTVTALSNTAPQTPAVNASPSTGTQIAAKPPEVTPPEPFGIAPPPGIVGPTDNITKVARAIQAQAKSLTTLVTVASGLALTQPVTIIIVLGGYCPTVITQSYVASTGNRFLHNDCEGDGKTRRGRVDLTLTEANPGGGSYIFSLPMNIVLDPLYDIAISPVKFTLIDDCDPWFDSEVRIWWTSVENQYRVHGSDMRAGHSVTISSDFMWSRAEVSATANLQPPRIGFFELDIFEKTSTLYQPPPSNVNLVPGKTQTISTVIMEEDNQCRASIEYAIKYELRWYPFQ
jgi:hypothetical protein